MFGRHLLVNRHVCLGFLAAPAARRDIREHRRYIQTFFPMPAPILADIIPSRGNKFPPADHDDGKLVVAPVEKTTETGELPPAPTDETTASTTQEPAPAPPAAEPTSSSSLFFFIAPICDRRRPGCPHHLDQTRSLLARIGLAEVKRRRSFVAGPLPVLCAAPALPDSPRLLRPKPFRERKLVLRTSGP